VIHFSIIHASYLHHIKAFYFVSRINKMKEQREREREREHTHKVTKGPKTSTTIFTASWHPNFGEPFFNSNNISAILGKTHKD